MAKYFLQFGTSWLGINKKRLKLNELSVVLSTQTRARTGMGCPTGV